jgi:hypothetical protein
MKRIWIVAALAVAALTGAGCSGCTSITQATKAVASDQAILGGQKIDEQVLSGVYALGSSANVLIEAAAKTGALTHDQVLLAQKIRKQLDAGIAAAQAAYDVGDAAKFTAKVAAVTELNKQATALFNEVKS